MKAILEFDLPEEECEHSYALAGADALIVIDELFNEIRSCLKYDSGELKGCDYDTLEKVRDLLFSLKQVRRLPDLI